MNGSAIKIVLRSSLSSTVIKKRCTDSKYSFNNYLQASDKKLRAYLVTEFDKFMLITSLENSKK